MATHVDDLIIVSKTPQKIMARVEQEFVLRNIEDSPTYYLGNDVSRIFGEYLHTAPKKYVQETLKN